MDNTSSFKICDFSVDKNYIPHTTFHKQVDLHGVNGIDFRGCIFTNTGTNGVSDYSLGIGAYGAGFTVEPGCTDETISPCPGYRNSSFSGFYAGVAGYTSEMDIERMNIWETDFQNNVIGVYDNGVDNAIIVDCDFKIGRANNSDSECGEPTGFGIDMQNATGFAIENNNFTKYIPAPAGSYVGVRVSNTESGYDEVYNNVFSDLDMANLAELKNWELDNVWQGLAYYCNENINNWADFYVKKAGEGEFSGIQARQGNDDTTAGNTFSPGALWHFYNGGDFEIGYYYYAYDNSQIPADHKLYHVTDEERFVRNNCVNHYGGGGIELTDDEKLNLESQYISNLADYNSIDAQYTALIDGGDTEAELADIQYAQPDDMWDLRAQLLGHSPHLSLDVLMKTSDRTDVFPDDVLFDILSANPDELKKDTLISYLENKEDPLPGYMIDILQQVAEGTTYKTVLQNQMAKYNRNKLKAAHDIVRDILNDTILNAADLRNWLDNIGGKRADEQIISTFLTEGNYMDAITLAGMMPALYGYEGRDSVEHVYYTDLLNLRINMKQQGRNIYQLDSLELASLHSIADESHSTAGSSARALLEYAHGPNYCQCPPVLDTAGFKKETLYPGNFEQTSGLSISAEPNPANTFATLNYSIPGLNPTGKITITDVSGKIIQSYMIKENQGQITWDTRRIDSGVYFYIFESNAERKSGKIVISK